MHPTSQTMPMGVVLERREIDNPWQSHSWRAVGVMPGAAPVKAPRLLDEGPGWLRYHLATLPVALHRRETEGYKRNLANEVPVVYIVLRFDEDDDGEYETPRADLVTVCPYEAQDYLDGGAVGESVESVPMPDGVKAWVQDYIERHHVDEVFVKRKRKNWKKGDGEPPPGDRRHG